MSETNEATERQAEPILAVLLTESEFHFLAQLVQGAEIPFSAHRIAAAVDAKLRGAMPVNRQPQEPQAAPEPEATPEEQAEPEG